MYSGIFDSRSYAPNSTAALRDSKPSIASSMLSFAVETAFPLSAIFSFALVIFPIRSAYASENAMIVIVSQTACSVVK